jgi:hypothetical protein
LDTGLVTDARMDIPVRRAASDGLVSGCIIYMGKRR